MTEQESLPEQHDDEPKQGNYLEPEKLNRIPLWLFPCHLVAGLFHLVHSFILFFVATRVRVKSFLYTNYPTKEGLFSSEYARPEPEQIAEYSITWYSGVFIMLAAIDHLIVVAPYFRELYVWHIERSQSPQRWIEYSISAALMKTLIAQICGVTDVHLTVSIFFLTTAMVLFGLLHEKMNARAFADGHPQDWSPFLFGCIMHAVGWGIVISYLIGGSVSTNGREGVIVGLAIISFLLDCSFATVFGVGWLKIGMFSDYLTQEFSFVMLSFISKTFLAWISFAAVHSGTLSRG